MYKSSFSSSSVVVVVAVVFSICDKSTAIFDVSLTVLDSVAVVEEKEKSSLVVVVVAVVFAE